MAFVQGVFAQYTFSEQHLNIMRETADRLAVALYNVNLLDELNRANTRLRTFSQRLVEIQEEERRNLARELHDEIGQSLTGLKLVLEAASSIPADKVHNQFAEAQDILSELMHHTRELSLILRPAMLDDLGLLPTLIWYIERYRRRTRVEVDFKYSRHLERRFSTDLETTVYRLIQEGLTNVARHARTNQVVVDVMCDEETIQIVIQDHGVGFDVKRAMDGTGGNGLAGMVERTYSLQGQISISFQPDLGASITVASPIVSQTSKE
ncbi:MAG: sensor histidine kinase [Chloroflexi bacterium]|nr:sensor histidine kinase [Chloroflexota bacterium]